VADGVALTPGFRDAVRHLLIEIGIPLARQPEAERLVLATTRAICVSVQAERTTPDAAADGTSSAER
jgi:hypothetical protein